MNTAKRHEEINAAAVKSLAAAGGIKKYDALSQKARYTAWWEMIDTVRHQTSCRSQSARDNVGRVIRKARFALKNKV